MISQIMFRRIHSTCIRPTRALTTAVFCSALLLISVITFYPERLGHAANHKRRQLTFEDRVAAQRAIESVYHQRHLWPKENPQPKPPLDEVMPDAAIRAKIADYLRKSAALEVYWQRAITPDELQAEMERMARDTRQPDALAELWAALGNDPMVIAECLARPTLVERLLRDGYASDERFHGELRRRAETELRQPPEVDAPARMRAMSGEYREVEWRLASDHSYNPQSAIRNPQSEALDAEQWHAQMDKLRRMFGAAEDNVRSPAFRRKGLASEPLPPEGGTTNAAAQMSPPSGQLSALQEDEERFYALMILEQSAERVKAAMVEWRKTPFDEWWSGVRGQMEMAAPAGGEYRLPEIAAVAAPCGGDAWTATSTTGTPSVRYGHSAVWTGSEMIVWGGNSGGVTNTGGRYNPATDSWTANITTTGAPNARYFHTAVWTGSEMIVWGGSSGIDLNTGGRYNPTTDSWSANITTTGAPSARYSHTAVWTGSEMIVWGGISGINLNTGGRYNPTTNSWTANITTTGAPSARSSHSAVWTGSEVIVWGGNGNGLLSGGGRYNPTTDSWTNNIAIAGGPGARNLHSAVWTGSEMIVWGGGGSGGLLNTGGRYNPATDSWTASTTTTGAPSARYIHSAVWTGSEMIVWGGDGGGNTGGRYSIPPPLILSHTTQSFTAAGGSDNIGIGAQAGCTWTATSNANWITITSGGTGNGAVSFSVAANTLGPRTGILTIGTRSFIVRQAGVATPRVIRAVTTGSAPGNIAVPIEIVSQGDENALGFTLTFDPAVLGNPQVALGADAAGGQLSTNTNQAAQGRLGIALALAAGQKFAAGTRQFAVVTFTTPANLASGMTPLDFDDLPTAREVSDVSANGLPASYQGGSISIVSGLEADVAPRPQGNGSVTITDWVQIGRFAAGLDTAAAGVEFQRADCAPRSTLGDGRLTVADWTQAGRYATGADAVAAAGGPTLPASQSSLVNPDLSPDLSLAGGHRAAAHRDPSVVRGRWLAAETSEQTANGDRRMTGFIVEIVALGDENAFGFSLQFDPAQWSLVSAATGRDTQGATLHVNASQAARGRIGVVLAMAAGQRLSAGARQIVIVRLEARGGRGAIEFGDYPVKREVVDAEANVTPSAFAIDRNRKQK